MQGVFFVPFPKFKTCLDKCQQWIRACCREGFQVTSIPRNTYMCSMQFVGGNSPTKDHPDPLPATATPDKTSPAWVRDSLSKPKCPLYTIYVDFTKAFDSID